MTNELYIGRGIHMTKDLTAQQFADKLGVTRQLIYYHAKKITPAEKVYNDENKLVFTPDQQIYLMSFMTETLPDYEGESLKEEEQKIKDTSVKDQSVKDDSAVKSINKIEETDEPLKGYSESTDSKEEDIKVDFPFDTNLAEEILLIRQNEEAMTEKSKLSFTKNKKENNDPVISPSDKTKDLEVTGEKKTEASKVNFTEENDKPKTNRQTPLTNDKDIKQELSKVESNDDLTTEINKSKSTESLVTNGKNIDKYDQILEANPLKDIWPKDNKIRKPESQQDKQEIKTNENDKQLSKKAKIQDSPALPSQLEVKQYIQTVVRNQLQDLWTIEDNERVLLVEEINVKNQQIADLHKLLDQQQQLMLISEQKYEKLLTTLSEVLKEPEYDFINDSSLSLEEIKKNKDLQTDKIEAKVSEMKKEHSFTLDKEKAVEVSDISHVEVKENQEQVQEQDQKEQEDLEVKPPVKKTWWQRLFLK